MLVPALASAALVASWIAQAERAPAEEPPAAQAVPPAAQAVPPAAAGPAAPAPVIEAPRRLVDTVAVHGRFAARAGGPEGSFPREGFSLGGSYDHRYTGVGGVFGLGAGVDFFFDRFQGGANQNSFCAMQTVVYERAPIRPWVAVGAGLGVASSTRAVVRGALGLELPFSRANSVAVRADLTHALSGADPAFGDLVDVGVGLVQHF
jgi:hypothetical protein